MHRQIDGAGLEAAIDDIAAVLRDRRPDPRLDQLADLLDHVGIFRVVLEIFRGGNADRGRAGAVRSLVTRGA